MSSVAISHAPAEHLLRVSRPRITMAMILCGIVTAAGIGAASAAGQQDDVPSVVVKYDPQSLQTDRGAHVLYRKIVAAAEQVCLPVISSSIRPSQAILQCRAQAIARAVTKINDPKLAAIHASASGNG
ncbi:MAG: UrcA family protein [Steroidobacteraceae bacterium]|jgi:UrcA family protein